MGAQLPTMRGGGARCSQARFRTFRVNWEGCVGNDFEFYTAPLFTIPNEKVCKRAQRTPEISENNFLKTSTRNVFHLVLECSCSCFQSLLLMG